jgi:hypothetical protein
MEDLYGIKINSYINDGEFHDGMFIVGYLNQRIDKFKSKKDIPEILDVRIPLSKMWLNSLHAMQFIRDYSENSIDREIEFIITDFYNNQNKLILTGKFEVSFGSLSYEYDPNLSYDPDDDPYLHFTLKEWKIKK